MRYHNGDSIGEYVVTGHLGSGGSADVYCVEHSITGRREALKILSAGIDEKRAERILREAKLQARLNHPNITAVHHAFWWKKSLALVMELVEGDSLRGILERGPVNIDTALSYARQILGALGHAHRRQVIHRDITPSNILITSKGVVKLTDFGLAKEPADRKTTQSGAVLGSLHYCSPEQIRSSGEVDLRTDIYSCGAVFYEMLAGRKLFEGDSSFDLMVAQTEALPEPPSRVNRQLPVKLDAVILKALRKDPAKRFATTVEFLTALEETQKRVPVLAYAVGAFGVVSMLLGAVTVRWQEPEVAIPGPPMPSVAIRVPPIPLPPMDVPGLPVEEVAPAPVKASVGVRPLVVVASQPVNPQPANPQVAAPLPVLESASHSTLMTAHAAPVVRGAAKVPPPPVTAEVELPEVSSKTNATEEKSGGLRGVVRWLFRKRASGVAGEGNAARPVPKASGVVERGKQ